MARILDVDGQWVFLVLGEGVCGVVSVEGWGVVLVCMMRMMNGRMSDSVGVHYDGVGMR